MSLNKSEHENHRIPQDAQIAQLVEQRTENPRVAGSIPALGIVCGCSSMVELQPSKLITWVRFPSPAWYLFKDIFERIYPFFQFTGKNYKQ